MAVPGNGRTDLAKEIVKIKNRLVIVPEITFCPCGEEVISSPFQGGVSGALPDLGTKNYFGVKWKPASALGP